MTVLIAGGAGYIGSHTAKELERHHRPLIIFDNFSSGHRCLTGKHKVIEGDLLDPDSLRKVFRSENISAVMHFASVTQVGESYRDPEQYYIKNLIGALNLLKVMREENVHRFVFSSSAAIYGEPKSMPITEDQPALPVNPYGETKHWIERILESYRRAYGLQYISLRYFNAAGADPEGEMGEMHKPETHLIPNLILTALGVQDRFELFGRDFPTEDGTAVRDFIHVSDLASAHHAALEKLEGMDCGQYINLGSNQGYSVLEVIRKTEEITGKKIDYIERPRRPGDTAILLASREKAASFLGWEPRLSDLETIIRTAWKWHSSRMSPV